MALNLCILASGRGSNFKAILNAINEGRCDAKILCLITDNPQAKAMEIARKNNIPSHPLNPKAYSTREEFDNAILQILKKYSPDLVALAGYMKILRSPKIFSEFKNKIINIHPSLLPKYPGAQAQKDAFEAGEKISGLTIHIVDESLDGGKILYQQKVDISGCSSAQEAADKILKFEHQAYPLAINKIAKGEIKLG